jgi:hypothetical protein
MHVYCPWWWVRKAGTSAPQPRDLVQEIDFDPIRGRFIDRWYPTGDRSGAVSDTIRCYAPTDFLLLLEGTGLRLEQLDVNGAEVDPSAAEARSDHPLFDAWKYLVQLTHDPPEPNAVAS